MFANRRQVSEKSPVDHKLLMQIRNGHLNEGFNSRKSSSASTKPISKYNLLHSYFECNFSGEYSKRIAQELKRQIKSCNKYKQLEPTFIDSVIQKILYVHNYNMKVMKVNFAYPLSNEFVELLVQYILIESRALYRRQDRIDVREVSVQSRILRILMHIFNAFFESKMVPPKEISEKSAKAIINIFIEIRRDYGVNNKLMENMTIKLLKRTGLFEKIDALKGKNLPCPLDTFLTDHAYSDIYKTTITSDYGTDDGLQMDDDVLIVDDDIVDIAASENNEIKKEDDNTILNKASTSPLTKKVLTICLDDSDFDSDEETCCFAEEVKTSKKSLEYQIHQRQEDKVSFHKRNHRPIDEVKTEAIKVDMSEESNFSNPNCKPVNSDVSHSEANLISNKTIVIKYDGIQCQNQTNIMNRDIDKSATVETEIVEISDEENEVEIYDDTGSSVFEEKIPTDFSVVKNVSDPDSEILESSNNVCCEELGSRLPVTVEDCFEGDLKGKSTEQPSSSTKVQKNEFLMTDKHSSNTSKEFESLTVIQNMTKEIFETVRVELISKDVKQKEDSLMEVIEKNPEKEPGLQSEVEGSNIETTNGLDSSRHGESQETEHIANSNDLQDDIEIEEIRVVEAVAVGENNPRNMEVDSVEQPTTDKNADICSTKTTRIIIHSLHKMNFKINEELSKFNYQLRESSREGKNVPCRKDIGSVSNEDGNINQINTSEVSDFKKSSTDIPNPIVNEINHKAKDSEKECAISNEGSFKISDKTESTSTAYTDSLTTENFIEENLIVDEIDTSNPDRHSFESMEDKISKGVEIDEQLLENLGTVSQLGGNNSEVDGIDSAIKVIKNNQPEPLPENTEIMLLEIGTNRESNYDESKNKTICNRDSSSKIVTNGISKDCEDRKDNLLFSKAFNVGTESNEDKVDLLSLPHALISNESHCDELFESTVVQEIGKIPSISVVLGEEEEEEKVAAEEKPTDLKYPFSPQESNQIKLSDASLPEQNDSENNLSIIEEAITNPNLQSEINEIYIPQINTGFAPNPEQSKSEEICMHQINTCADNIYENNTENDILEGTELDIKASIQGQKSRTQEINETNIDETFTKENSYHFHVLAENQKSTGTIKRALQSTQPFQDKTLLEESNINEQLFTKDLKCVIEVEVRSDDPVDEPIIPNSSIDSHGGEEISCIQENAESNIDGTFPNKNSGYSDELAENEQSVEIIEGAIQSTQPRQGKTLEEENNFDEQVFNKDSEFAIELEVRSDDPKSEVDDEPIIPHVSIVSHGGEEKSCIQENVESNIDGTFPNENSDHSHELAEDEKAAEIIEGAFQSTQPLQDKILLEKSNNDGQIFNEDSEFAIEVEVRSDYPQPEHDVEHIIPDVSIDSRDDEQISCIQENVDSHIDETFPNDNSDHFDEWAKDQKSTEVTEEAFQGTQPLQAKTSLEESNIDEQLFNKNSECANEVEVRSNYPKSVVDDEPINPNVSIDSHDGAEKSCSQEKAKSNIDRTFPKEKAKSNIDGNFPKENSNDFNELAGDKNPAKIIDGGFQNTQPLQDTTLLEENNIDDLIFNKDSESAIEVEVQSDDPKSEVDDEPILTNVSIDSHGGEEKSCIQENVKSNINGTFSNEYSDHSDELSESKKPAEIIEEAFQITQPLQDKTLEEKSNIDEQLFSKNSESAFEVEVGSGFPQSEVDEPIIQFQNTQLLQDTTLLEENIDEQIFNKDSECAIEVEVRSDNTLSGLDVKPLIPNVSIVSHDIGQKSCIQENVETDIDTTSPSENSEIKNEIVKLERQSIQGNLKKSINEGDTNEYTTPSVEYAKTIIKESGEWSKQKMEEKANEPLFEFHNEFAIEVEIGTDDVHSDGDINNMELCNVTDQVKIVQGDSTIENQLIKSTTEKHISGSPDQNVWRSRENLHTSIISESQDSFGLHDSGIASNSGSSDGQDNQSLQADLESEVDLSLCLKWNAVDIFVQNDVTAVPQDLDLLAGLAVLRERVIEEKKPLRRGRSSKAENDNVSELFEKDMSNRKKQTSSLKVSKYKNKIEETPKLRTLQTAKKVVRTPVNDNIRVTRSSHLKNSNENVETSFKPHDFLSVKNSIPPANKMYADRVVDVNFTSEDSNDSESNKLLIDEEANAKSKDFISKPLLDPLSKDEVGKYINEAELLNTKSKDNKSKPLQDQLGEYEVDTRLNGVSKISDYQIQVDEVDKKKSEDIVEDVGRSIYDEDSLDEKFNFCYEPNLEPKISVQQNYEDFNLAEEHQQFPPQNEKVVSFSRSSSVESNKPFRTKAERKAYNQPGPNPYISIERLNVSGTEKNDPIEKQNKSKSLDIGRLGNIGSKSKRLQSKENLKRTTSIKVEPKENTDENTESVMIANIKEDINHTEQTEDNNIPFTKLSGNSETNLKVIKLGDFDETPLAERIKEESQEYLAETSVLEEIAMKSKQKSKRSKTKWKTTKKKRATQVNKTTGEPVQDTYKAAAELKNKENDNLASKNILEEKKPTAVFHSFSQIKFENFEETSNRKYCTLPKLRRKSMSKDNLSRSVSSATFFVSTSDIRDEDKKCMPPPKLRGKSYANGETFKEQNTAWKWTCKNTVSQTTEKLMKKLCEEVSTINADVELQLRSDGDIEEQVNSSYLAVNVEIPLSQKPLVDTVEQRPYNLCERNLEVTSDLPPETEFSNWVNPSIKKETSSNSILNENSAKSIKDSLYENYNESNDIVYDLSLKPLRKVHNEKPATVIEVEGIPVITDHENVVEVAEHEKDTGKLSSSSNEKIMLYESDLVSAQIPVDIQKDDVSMESKKSIEVESDKLEIGHANIENLSRLPSCPSEEVTDILSKPNSPQKNEEKSLGDYNPGILQVEHKSLDELSSPSKNILETTKLKSKAITSHITQGYSSKKQLFNKLQNLSADTFKNAIDSDSRNEAKECEKTQTDIATNLSQTNGNQKNQTLISKAPNVVNESSKTPGLPNEESECIKTKLEKRKYDDSSEGSKRKKRRNSRKVETHLNVSLLTATVDTENITDANLIEVVRPGFEGEKTQENEQKMKTASSLGTRRMQINQKEKMLLSPLKTSKSPSDFVDVITSKKQKSKKTDGASDDIKNEVTIEEIKGELSQTEIGSTPKFNVCLDFSSETSKNESGLSIQEISPIVQKQVQSEEIITEVSINSGEIDKDLLVSSNKHISPKKSGSNSSEEKKIDAVKIVKQEMQNVHTTKNAKRKYCPKSKSEVHTAKDGEENIEYVEYDSTRTSSSKSTHLKASKIVSEMKEPLSKKILVSGGKPLQEISKRSLSKSYTDDVDKGIDKHLKKLNKTYSKLQPRSYSHGGRSSLISRFESNIIEDITEGDDEEIVEDQNNIPPTISTLSPEEVCEKSKAPSEQLQNQSISLQKSDSDKTVTIAETAILSSPAGDLKKSYGPESISNDSAVLKITQKDAHSKNENQTSVDFLNRVMTSNSVCLEETEKIHSSNKTEAICNFKEEVPSNDSPMKDKELHGDHYSCEKKLEEKEKLYGHDCLDNIKQDSLENTEKSHIVSLDSTLQTCKELRNKTSTSDYSLIMESESTFVSNSNEIELGSNVVEEKSNNKSVDEYQIVNDDVTSTDNTSVDQFNEALMANTGNSPPFSNSRNVEVDLISHSLRSESDQIIHDKSQVLAKNAPLPSNTDLIEEKTPVINRDFSGLVQEKSGTEVIKINVHEETSQNNDLCITRKRKKIITSELDSEKPAEESNAGKLIMRELTILIDNSTVDAKSSPLSESPRKRERKSIESVVTHLKEKDREICSSFDSTNPVTAESVKSNWVSSRDGGSNRVFADFNSPLWLKSDEIPDIHSEVVVSSDQPALISSSLSKEGYTNQDLVDTRCTMSYENNRPVEQDALGKTTGNIELVSSCDNDLNPLHFIPEDDMFGLEDSRQSTNIEQTSNLSEDSSSEETAIKITNLSPTESSANDANVEETFQNLANLRHFGKPMYFKMQTNVSPFGCSSNAQSNGGHDKHDFAQMMSVEPTDDHISSELRQPGTLTSIYNCSLSRNKDISKLDQYTGYAADTPVPTCNFDSGLEKVSSSTIKSFNNDNSETSLNFHDISPCKMSIGSTQTLDLISNQNDQLNQNILGQISGVNSFITGVAGSPNQVTPIIPVSKQADFSQSFKNSFETNNSDHSYYFPADPVMSIAGEDIFPKGMSDASSELPSNDNPLRDFELSDDFSEFLNPKQVSEEKDSEEKDCESNQNDDYKLRIDNETITQNLVEISRSRQSKEINKLYDLLDSDKMEPDYTAEPSRDPGLWESIIESDQSTQKVIVLPNNHCLTSPFDMTHTDLLEADQSTQKVIVEPNNHCLTPTFNMSHTDLYNSFDVSPPGPQCYNPMPPEKSESVASLLKETVFTSFADCENNCSTLGVSKKDPKKDYPGDLKKPKKSKKSVPKKIEKDQKGEQADILPTRSYGRTIPSQWIKRSNQLSINNSKVNQSSSSPVEKQDPAAGSSKEVVSTDNLLELSFTKSARILPEKAIVIQGIAATKTEIASTRIPNTPSVSVKEVPRQKISKPDTPKTKAETPIIQPTVRHFNEKVHCPTIINANITKVSKSSSEGLLPRVAQYKVTPVKHDHKLPLQKLSHEYKGLGKVDQNFSCANMKDFVEHDAVVQNIADIVKSRKRIATNLYSSRPLTEENVKNSSHYRPKRRKTPTELNFNGKLTGVKTKTAENPPAPVAELVESDNSRRSQGRGSSRSSVEPTTEAEDPLRKRFKTDEKTSQDLHSKPAGSKYPVNYSIDRILGKDSSSANESRHTNEDPVKDCREREGRDFTRSSSGIGIKSGPEVGKTEGSATEDPFDRLVRQKNETPFPHREHSTMREKKYPKPDPAYRNNERGFNNEKSHRERIPREGSIRVHGASHDHRSQERDSRLGNKRYTTYQGHSRDPYPPYPPEQRRSSGGYYPSTGSSRHSNYRHSGVSSSRSNISHPSSSTPQQSSRSSLLSPRSIIEGEEHKWAAKLIDRGLLDPLSESTPQFFPQKSPRDK